MTKRKVISISAICVAVLAIGGIGWLFASGRIALVVKEPEDKVAKSAAVCGDDIITKYNSAFEATTEADYSARIKEAYDMTAGLDKADTDPNCAFIKFSYNIRNKNYDEARKNVATLKELESSGAYITSRIANPQSTSAMQNMLDAVDTESDQTSEPSAEPVETGSGDGRG